VKEYTLCIKLLIKSGVFDKKGDFTNPIMKKSFRAYVTKLNWKMTSV